MRTSERDILMSEIPLVAVVAITILLAVIAIALVVLVLRRTAIQPAARIDTLSLMDAVKKIRDEAQHYADVSAVVELVRQLDADPDALELIKTYPATVQAAARLHYINSLGADAKVAHDYLSNMHHSYSSHEAGPTVTAQKKVDAIHAKIEVAVKASGQGRIRAI